MADLRMPDTNMVVIAGRLGRDAELKYTTGNVALCAFDVANERRYKTRDGEKRSETTWLAVRCWRQLAEAVAPLLLKGTPVLLQGRLVMEEREGRDGKKRREIRLEADRIDILEWAESGRQGEPTPREDRPSAGAARPPGPLPQDDLPF